MHQIGGGPASVGEFTGQVRQRGGQIERGVRVVGRAGSGDPLKQPQRRRLFTPVLTFEHRAQDAGEAVRPDAQFHECGGVVQARLGHIQVPGAVSDQSRLGVEVRQLLVTRAEGPIAVGHDQRGDLRQMFAGLRGNDGQCGHQRYKHDPAVCHCDPPGTARSARVSPIHRRLRNASGFAFGPPHTKVGRRKLAERVLGGPGNGSTTAIRSRTDHCEGLSASRTACPVGLCGSPRVCAL